MLTLMIREDVPPAELRRLAKAEDDPRVTRRLLATYGETGMGRLMRGLDLSWQTPRPRHAGTDRAAQEAFKKRALPPPSRRSRPTTRRPSASRSGSRTRPG
jgi:hypothetical protein